MKTVGIIIGAGIIGAVGYCGMAFGAGVDALSAFGMGVAAIGFAIGGVIGFAANDALG